MSYLGLFWSKRSFCLRSRKKRELLYTLLISASGAPSVILWELFICHKVAYFWGRGKMCFFVLFLKCTLRCLSPAPRHGPEHSLDWQQLQTLLGGSTGLSPAVVSQSLLARSRTQGFYCCAGQMVWKGMILLQQEEASPSAEGQPLLFRGTRLLSCAAQGWNPLQSVEVVYLVLGQAYVLFIWVSSFLSGNTLSSPLLSWWRAIGFDLCKIC